MKIIGSAAIVWLGFLSVTFSSCIKSGEPTQSPNRGLNQPVVDASGKKIYTIDPSIGAVLTSSGISSSDPRFANVAVAIPSGALSLPVSVSLFEAQSLASPSTSYVLGASNLTAAGPTVAVIPSQSVTITGSLALSIPYSALMALTGDKQLVVIAIYPGESKNELETFVGDELDTSAPGIIKISAKKFGAFQVVYSDTVIEKKNVETTAEIRSIADAPPSPRVPILSYAGSTGTAGKFGEPMSVAPTKLESNGSPITGCGIKIPTTALPSWAAVNPSTCVISGTPTDGLSSTTYTLVATNSAGQSLDAAVTLSVDPLIPTLNYADITAVGAVGTPMSVAPTTLQTNGANVTACGIKSGSPALPSWASVNATTCVISGIPNAILSPTAYTLVATNSAGQSADATISLSVSAGVPTLSYSGASGTTGRFGVAMSVAPQLLASNGATVTSCAIKFGSAALPAWASINGNTCLISGVPDALLSPTTYTLVATNSAGQSADASLSLSVGPSAPTLSYVGATGASGTFGTAMSISPTTLATNGAPITGCAIKTATIALPTWATVNASTCVISGTPNAVLNQTSYTIRAVNSEGASFDASVTLSVGAAKPTLSYSGDLRETNGTFGFAMLVSPKTLSNNGAAITSCNIKSGTTPLPGWATVNGSTCVISGTPNAVLSATTFTLVASNSAGQSDDATVSLSVWPRVPTLSYANATGRVGTFGVSMSVTPTTLSNNGASITSCGVKVPTTPLPTWASVNSTTCVISGTPNAVLSSTSYTLVATNSAGQSSDATVSLSVGAAVPTLSYSGTAGTSGTFGTALSISPTTLSTNGASITGCAIKTGTTPLPAWANVNTTTCVISGTPNAVLDNTSYTLRATNSAGFSNDAIVNLSVAAAVPILSYSGAAGTNGTFGTAMSITPTMLSPNGSAITGCAIKVPTIALPAWATLNAATCKISGTPNAVLSSTSFTIVATNAIGQSADATISLSVGAAVPTLSYSGATGTTGIVGVAMSVTPTILANNGAPVTSCGVRSGTTALPSWVTINQNTCVISGLTNSVFSSTTYSLVAINSAGQSQNASVNLSVVRTPPTLSYTGASGTNGTFGTPISVSPTTLSNNGATITNCGIKSNTTQLPSWAIINPTTCIISGTPNAVLGSTTYTVVATNSQGTSPDASVTLSVGAVAPTLNFAGAAGGNGTFGVAMSVTPTLSTNGAAITDCNVKPGTPALPNWASINPTTCAISGVPTAVLSSTTFAIVASNAAGQSSDAFVTLSVSNSDLTPIAIEAFPDTSNYPSVTWTPNVKFSSARLDNIQLYSNTSGASISTTTVATAGVNTFVANPVSTLGQINNVYAKNPLAESFFNMGSYQTKLPPNFSVPGVNGSIDAMVTDSMGNLYVGGQFSVAGSFRANNIAKWNGSTWSALGSGLVNNNNSIMSIDAMVVDSAGNLYVGGYFSNSGGVAVNNIAKWNGSTWSALGSGLTSSVEALAVDSVGNLYAGGQFTAAGGSNGNYIAKWNGTSWSSLGTGMNGVVDALALDASGKLYAGGSFTTAGGVSANYIARWDGNSWNSLGGGMNSIVYALTFDSNGTLYAGGSFTSAGGVSANRIAKWSGTTWSALGSGPTNSVEDLKADAAGNIYASGWFDRAGDVTVKNIAKWNGSTWSALGAGIDRIRAPLAVDSQGNLYAGKLQWNGSAWSEIGAGSSSGLNGSIYALVRDSSDNLYAGGSFTRINGLTTNYIAKWNGSTWSALGTGLNGTVHALVVDSSGNLYAGGRFTTAGGQSAKYVAKWDGSSWTALGSGPSVSSYTDGIVIHALAIDSSGNLYAGGQFLDDRISTGTYQCNLQYTNWCTSQAANYVAKWNGSSWSFLDRLDYDGTGGDAVYALTFDSSGALIAGGDFMGKDRSFNNIAKWNGSSWVGLGGGQVNYVNALATDLTGNLYAGLTDYSTVNGVVPNFRNIAKWNGSSWSNLSGYPGGQAKAIAVDSSGNLYVSRIISGSFEKDTFAISKWNGSSWSSLGTGMDQKVNVMVIDPSGRLYAGGDFGTVNSMVRPFIAIWIDAFSSWF